MRYLLSCILILSISGCSTIASKLDWVLQPETKASEKQTSETSQHNLVEQEAAQPELAQPLEIKSSIEKPKDIEQEVYTPLFQRPEKKLADKEIEEDLTRLNAQQPITQDVSQPRFYRLFTK